MAALWVFLSRTDLGRAIRAVGQDRQVARLLGINDRVVYTYAFGISTAIMGIAAAALLPFYYTHPAVGTSFSTPLRPDVTPVVYPTRANLYGGPRVLRTPPWWPSGINYVDLN